ncbi:aspartyl protease family protein 1-like [Cynara cardunculus var. scolymus]|uniref:aspartyl protease family protein 1-like n=1 Tax=Cynara cardunculus var. scolymus TaxID=59895 RepID=UPI000D630D00|nr:aspartyl protease family protein 1-like [Cynara cardunculus var. scolymus]
MQSFLVFLITFLSIWGNNFIKNCYASVFTLKMHHRFSEPVKKWSESINKLSAGDFPSTGSVEFYSQLADHDRVFRGRGLSDSGEQRLTFSDGNSSLRIKSLGFLHYTTVSLGTPGQKFLVALDTGSDLFWVPCECSRCASIDNTPFSAKFNMSIYNPKESSTGKKVTCNHRMCTASCPGSGTVSTCSYSSSYVSSQTSTSGILMEDFLHLETDDGNRKIVNAFVTFGCGQVQSGSFLHIAAPNGLFGLGMEKISVPSLLAKERFIADSFSMCFGHDGSGRISFGDKGSIYQEETPFSFDASHPTYTITATQLRVGAALINSSFTALFDSGTSFTYLVEPHYTRLTKMFHAQTKDSRRLTDKRIPFEYCYAMSPDANTSLIPDICLTMKGDGQFIIYDPVIVLPTHPEVIYCLAVIKNEEMSIIGQNFMTGYRIVFDREKLVLGWKKSSCYDVDNTTVSPSKPLNTDTVPPAVAAGLEGEGTETRTKIGAQSSVASSYNLNFCYSTHNCIHALIIHSLIVVISLGFFV